MTNTFLEKNIATTTLTISFVVLTGVFLKEVHLNLQHIAALSITSSILDIVTSYNTAITNFNAEMILLSLLYGNIIPTAYKYIQKIVLLFIKKQIQKEVKTVKIPIQILPEDRLKMRWTVFLT